jgi:hypothetical protein
MYKSKNKMLDYAWREFEKTCNLKKSSKNKKLPCFHWNINFLGGRSIDTCIFSFLPTHFSFFWSSYALLQISFGSFDR